MSLFGNIFSVIAKYRPDQERDGRGRFADGGGAISRPLAPVTPEFRSWFKDSKVVDKDGNPQVVYHGSRASFSEFKTDQEDRSSLFDRLVGSHFAVDPAVPNAFVAGEYAYARDYNVDMYNPDNNYYRGEDGKLKYDGLPVLVKQDANGHDEVVEPYTPEKHGGVWGLSDRLGKEYGIRMLKPGGMVYPVYLKIQKPLVVEPKDHEFDQNAVTRAVEKVVFPLNKKLFVEAFSQGTGWDVKDAGVVWDKIQSGEGYKNGRTKWKNWDDFTADYGIGLLDRHAREAKEILQGLGYDGIRYRNTSTNEVAPGHTGDTWIAFNSHQIKSAFNQKPTDDNDISKRFDPSQPRDEHGRWTGEFKTWFGNSKVVDARGEPLPVYHGSKNEFSVFDLDKAGSNNDTGMWGTGFYFSPDKKMSLAYGDKLKRVYLSLQNPFIINGNTTEFNRKFNPSGETHGAAGKDASDALRGQLIAAGYDGVMQYEPTYNGREHGLKLGQIVAFHPNQIKLVSNKLPTDDPDISKAWDEGKHPRDKAGKFSSSESSAGGVVSLDDFISGKQSGGAKFGQAYGYWVSPDGTKVVEVTGNRHGYVASAIASKVYGIPKPDFENYDAYDELLHRGWAVLKTWTDYATEQRGVTYQGGTRQARKAIEDLAVENGLVTNEAQKTQLYLSRENHERWGMDYIGKSWDESAHPREPKGEPIAKRIASKLSASCVMAMIEPSDAVDFLEFGSEIPDAELYKEGADFGRTEDIHATCLYGLETQDIADIKPITDKVKPFTLVCGRVTMFDNADNDKPFQPVYVPVWGGQLTKLNRRLKALPYKNDYDKKFIGHICIAYVKKPFGKKWVGDDRFVGKVLRIKNLMFSTPDKGKFEIPLGEKEIGKDAEFEAAHPRGEAGKFEHKGEAVDSVPPVGTTGTKIGTDTPEFKNWFEGSRVTVDGFRNSAPLVMYHGTKKDFAAYDPATDSFGGFYAASDPEAAYAYARGKWKESPQEFPQNANIVPVYMSIKNPFDGNAPATLTLGRAIARAWWDVKKGTLNAKGEPFKNNRWSIRDMQTAVSNSKGNAFSLLFQMGIASAPKTMVKVLEKMGFDGIKYTGTDHVMDYRGSYTQYAAFRPEQIKSVYNRGTWDAKDPQISKTFDPSQPRDKDGKWTGGGDASYKPDRIVGKKEHVEWADDQFESTTPEVKQWLSKVAIVEVKMVDGLLSDDPDFKEHAPWSAGGVARTGYGQMGVCWLGDEHADKQQATFWHEVGHFIHDAESYNPETVGLVRDAIGYHGSDTEEFSKAFSKYVIGRMNGDGGYKTTDAKGNTYSFEADRVYSDPDVFTPVVVDVAKMDESFQKDKQLYVKPGGEEKRGSREGTEAYLATGKPIQMATVGLAVHTTNEVHFTNGRHRFAVLRDRGVKTMPVMVYKDVEDEFKKRFGA